MKKGTNANIKKTEIKITVIQLVLSQSGRSKTIQLTTTKPSIQLNLPNHSQIRKIKDTLQKFIRFIACHTSHLIVYF